VSIQTRLGAGRPRFGTPIIQPVAQRYTTSGNYLDLNGIKWTV